MNPCGFIRKICTAVCGRLLQRIKNSTDLCKLSVSRTVAYSSVEDAALMHALGPGTHGEIWHQGGFPYGPGTPQERPFLAVLWEGGVYIDCQLLFGLASPPSIISAVAEALEWIFCQRGVQGVLHYLDNFLLGAPDSPECTYALATTIATCEELGVPLSKKQIEGPVTSLTFLGIRLYSDPLQVSLPQEKHSALQSMLQQIIGARYVWKGAALESLVGHLIHATKVWPLEKTYVSGLFQVL